MSDKNGRQQRVLRAIVEFKRQHDGVAPTVREIGDMTGLTSTSVVNYTLRELVAQGVIKLGPKGAVRWIEIVHKES
jgi:SOS-response transcriptional repressor LexA